jgi:RimJ/RimL family protein N-acetyltransferase
MIEPVRLEGRHVRLEPLDLDHVPALVVAARHDRRSFSLTEVPDDDAGMQDYVETALAARAAGKAIPFATIDRAAGRVVGSTRFGNIERWRWPAGHAQQRAADRPDAVEIGWTWLDAAAQRTGINTEAKLLMLSHAFEVWLVHRVSLMTDARNTRCRAAIERLGASLDGVLRAARPAADGALRDTAAYSIVRADWPACKTALRERLR